MTQAIVEIAKPLGIAVHDRIIVGKDGSATSYTALFPSRPVLLRRFILVVETPDLFQVDRWLRQL